jgi:parallel beta-helix repeat protein
VASPGDTISICRGTYTGGVVVGTPNIRIQALSWPGSVVVRPLGGEAFGFAILLDGVRIEKLVVQGFSFAGIVTAADDPGNPGFFFPTSRVVIEYNDIHDNNIGVFLSASDGASIRGNRVHRNDLSGIIIDGSNNVSVKGNIVERNGQAGIFLRFANNSDVMMNDVERNASGIFLESSTGNKVRYNWVEENETDGIVLCFASTGNRVGENWIEENGANGILVCSLDDTGNRVEKNRLEDNAAFDLSDGAGGPPANTYANNKCDTSNPAGLCKRKR